MWINIEAYSVSFVHRNLYRIRFADRYSAQKRGETATKIPLGLSDSIDSINIIKRKQHGDSKV